MKTKEERKSYPFDNRALFALILPLVIEQMLAVLVGMADSIMIASVGGIRCIPGGQCYASADQCFFRVGYWRSSGDRAVSGPEKSG